jgi:hypothetical protein
MSERKRQKRFPSVAIKDENNNKQDISPQFLSLLSLSSAQFGINGISYKSILKTKEEKKYKNILKCRVVQPIDSYRYQTSWIMSKEWRMNRASEREGEK